MSWIVSAVVLIVVGSMLVSPPLNLAGRGPGPAATVGATVATPLQKAESSLVTGQGPAHGIASTCHSVSEKVAHCSPAAAPRPSIAGVDRWFNVTFNETFFFGFHGGYYASMAWDPTTNYVLFFGGCYSGQCPNAETWVYTATLGWLNYTGLTGSTPDAVILQSMDYNPFWGGVIMIGGTNFAVEFNNTWLFSDYTWTNITSSAGTPPSAREASYLAWDPSLNADVLFGGCFALCVGTLSDTWELTVAGWTQVTPTNSPGPRGAGGMAFDGGDGYLVLFGGFVICGAFCANGTNETWTFSGTTWTNATYTSRFCFIVCFAPSARDGVSMTWDPAVSSVVMYGGNNVSTGLQYNDTWEFAGGTWFWADLFINLNSPPSRAFAAMPPTSAAGGGTVLAGGFCSNTTYLACPVIDGDVWTFDSLPNVTSLVGMSNPADVGANITFTATISGGTSPMFGIWSHGDANYSYTYNGSTQVWNYSTIGTFHANVTFYDFFSLGSNLQSVAISTVTAVTGTANATSSPADSGQNITFRAAGSLGVSPYSYAWDFGDGSPLGLGATITHSYAAAGGHNASVTITDSGGGSTTVVIPVTINPALAPHAAVSMAAADVDTTLTFTGSASGGSGTYSSFKWSFSDGGSAITQVATHGFSAPGTYSGTVTVTDSLNYSRTATVTVTINSALAAAPTATPSSTNAGDQVNFSAGASGGTMPYTYRWTFGDGSSSTAANPPHSYSDSGTYAVTLTVNDTGGGSVQRSLTVTVSSPSSGGLGGLVSGGWLTLILILIAVIVVAAVVGLLMMRRKKGGAGTPPSAPPPGASGPPPGASMPPPSSGTPPP